MYISFKFRLYPTAEQEATLSKFFGATRRLYNYGLNLKIKNHQQGIKMRRYDITYQLPSLKKEYPRLAEVHSQVLASSLLNLNKAFTNFFRSHSRFPRFKSKHDNHHSINYPQGIQIEDGKVYLPKIGWVELVLHRPLVGKVKTCTVSRTPTNKYFISVCQQCPDQEVEEQNKEIEGCIGIDVGVKNFAVCSDGTVYGNPKRMKAYERRLRIRSRRHNRKQKGSSNKNKSRLTLSAIHEKVANQREDYIHKITKEITSNPNATNFAIENLNTKGMMRNRKLAKAIGQVGWYKFKQKLKYKAEALGKPVTEIGRFDPSSKICSVCGTVKSDLKLSDRIFKCECGNEIDRDLQASINIKNFAFKSV